MKCMISQPTFLPWLGWFDLMSQSDVVVLFDTAQFSRQSWQQRNRIRTSHGLEFFTVPVKKAGRFGQKIMEVEILDAKFALDLKNKLKTHYASSPNFEPVMSNLEERLPILLKSKKLSYLNEGLIRFCMEWLSIDTKVVRASDLIIEGRRGEYLAKVCEYLKCDEYLSTKGAENYLKEDHQYFLQRDIAVKIHHYQHPSYDQIYTPFIPYSSAIDLIMIYGDKSKEVMQGGKRLITSIDRKL